MAATEHIENKAPFPISEQDQKDIERLYGALRKGKAKLVGPDGESRPLPNSLHSFLVDLIEALQQGKCVQILQGQARLTTAQAANILGMSRQFLVNLLEAGEIPYHKVGTHRRIYVHDLMKYKAKRDDQRKKSLRDLVAAEVAENLYEKVPPSSQE
jgi:excisionase family DNA binding protein